MTLRVTRANALASLWGLCAVVLALGSAGIVSGMEHVPGTPARAELTWSADQRISPELAGSATDLRRLTADVDALSTLGTNALAAVTNGDKNTIQFSISNGEKLLAMIATETAALRVRLAGLPGVGAGAEARFGGVTLERYQTLTNALAATDGLGDSWQRLTTGGLAAVQLEATLLDHDAATAAAAQLGSAAKYAEAVTQLEKSAASIADARQQTTAMSGAVDTSTLTGWVDRNEAYDIALGKLYALLDATKGKVTKPVQAAYADEQAARALLPGDTRGLVVIMGDLARGELNQAVINIEDAKGQLSSALVAFDTVGP